MHGYIIDFDIRIMPASQTVFALDNSVIEGRVEVYYHGIWGGVCDSNITMMEANAICRSVGYM